MDAVPEVWIGLVDVGPMPGNDSLEGAKGALVNVIACVKNRAEFDQAATRELAAYQFFIRSMKNVRPLSADDQISDELRQLAEQAETPGQVEFGAFHSYEEDETLN